MKKKSVFLSKVFAVALAASMAFSTPYASAALVTTSTTYEGTQGQYAKSTDGWWTVWSDFYRVSGDFDVTFEFNNKGDQTNNWCNYSVVFSNAVDYAAGDPNQSVAGYKEYYLLRSDCWGWSVGGGDNQTIEGNEVKYTSDWPDWETFLKMMADAKISMNITRTGNDFAVKAVINGADSKTYNYGVNFTMEADKDMNIFFASDNAEVTMLSFKDNKAASTDAPDATTPPADDTQTPDTTNPPADDTQTPDTTNPPSNDIQTPDTTNPPADDNQNQAPDTTESVDDNEDNEPEAVEPTLSKKKLTVKVGKSKTLKVNDAEGTVKWSSNKKKVAKVNKNGKITGVKAGKATITAKVDGKTLKCKVTVKK